VRFWNGTTWIKEDQGGLSLTLTPLCSPIVFTNDNRALRLTKRGWLPLPGGCSKTLIISGKDFYRLACEEMENGGYEI